MIYSTHVDCSGCGQDGGERIVLAGVGIGRWTCAECLKKPDPKDQEIERLKAELETIHKEMAEDAEEPHYSSRATASQRRIYTLKDKLLELRQLCKTVVIRPLAHHKCECDFCLAVHKIRTILLEKP